MKPSGRSSLRTRLAFTLALALALPVALGIGQGYYNYRDQRVAAERNLVQTARLVTAEYQSLMANARKVLTTLVAQPDVRNLSMPACGTALRNALALLPEYDLALAIDANGTIRCGSQDVDRRIVVRDWPWFQRVIQGADFTVADFEPNAVINRRTLVAAIPVESASGRRTGTLALFINLDVLGTLSEHRDAVTRTYLTILDPGGNELPLKEAAPFIPPNIRRTLVTEGQRQEIMVHRNVNRQGRETMFVVAALPFTELFAVLAQPSQSIFAWLGVKLAADVVPPLLIWLVAIGTAGLAMHRMVLRWMLQLRRLVMQSLYGQNVDRGVLRFEEAPQEVKELADSFVTMMQTIDARNAQLKDAVAHRDMLIKEIHHRVKNNLQIISSLLNLQSRALRDDVARETLLGLQNRVNALALIHRSLYETQEQEVVELQGFLGALCHQMEELVGGRQIYILSEVPHYVVSAETAVTLAMLVTEVVTNATKHAFVRRKNGRVLVELIEGADATPTQLIISDNGSGGFSMENSADIGPREGQGLGRELIKGYVRQLRGEMTVEQRDGTRVIIAFKQLR
jgi:two-component sensor histidine kinase